MTIDLHVHSTFSDGSMSPAELVRYAKKKGLSAIGITDHDTIDGIEEATKAGSDVGMEVVPGLEISVKYSGLALHLLGYFIHTNDSNLKRILNKLQEARYERNKTMLSKLNGLGIKIDIADLAIISNVGQTGRPHFGKVLINKGIVKSMDEAFTKYLAKGAAAYAPRFVYDAVQAISLIKNAGGIAVLAHPLQLVKSGEKLSNIIEELAISGLDGLEVYYPTHSKKNRKMLLEIANNFDLVVTGGSDYHGDVRPGTTLAGGKNVSVPAAVLIKMKQRVIENRNANSVLHC